MNTDRTLNTIALVASLIFGIGVPLAQAQGGNPPEPPVDGGFAELQEGAEGLAQELESARKLSSELAAEIAEGATRSASIPAEIAALKEGLAKNPAPEAPPATADEATLAAYQETLKARAAATEQIAALEAEAAAYQASAEQTATRKRAADDRANALAGAYERWQQAADAARTREAASARVAVGERAVAFADVPALAELAEANHQLAARRAKASEGVAEAHRYESDIDARSERLRKERLSAEKRVKLLEAAGLGIDAETGRLLRAQRARLPNQREMRAKLKGWLRDSAQTGLERLSLEAELDREGFGDLGTRVAAIIADAPAPKPDPEAVKALLEERREIYDALAADLEKRSSALSAANEKAARAVDDVIAHARFLDERLLWIPSAGVVSRSDFAGSAKALGALAASLTGGGWLSVLGRDFKSTPLAWAACILALAYLLVRRRTLRGALAEAGVAASRRNCQSFAPTALALGCTLLLVLPLPLALGFLAWRCEQPSAPGTALLAGAIFTALVGSARLLSKPGGVLEAHFRIETKRAAQIHRNLNWFLPLGGTVVVIAAALPDVAPPPAGRLFFMLAMLLLMVFLHRLLRPAKGLVRRRGKPTKFAYLWYWSGIVIPATLAVGAGLGYFESVQALRLRAIGSLWLLLVILFVTGLMLRWILVSRRRLAVAQALRRREVAAAERRGEGAPDLPSLETVKAAAIDVVGVGDQTARLVHVAAVVAILFGLIGIWADTLPALSVLDRVPLWPADTAAVSAPSTPAGAVQNLTPGTGPVAGDKLPSAGEPLPALLRPATDGVTLEDLLFAIVLLVLTFVAAGNIPGLLELTLLRRLDLKSGASFALTTSVRYLIVLVGVVAAFGKIGITWSKVQWIAAAITLGIGFGLQEVFANFVAGLILLFERPFRIGDTVTVGEVSGKVTQIRMRATTIRQFNNRELVVPNKDFITGQLVNWTLSDSVLRFELPVGIAYGSDTELARRLLLDVARDHPRVLDEPEPQVVFTSFGDSALSFELRVHVGSVEDLVGTKTDLHYAIDEAFREAGIEIAFPQTDIHIRSMPEVQEADA